MCVLNEAILSLEKNDIASTDLHDIMKDLKDKITSRLTNKFYGSKVKDSLKYLSKSQGTKLILEADKVYNRTLTYLNKFYDYETSPFALFNIFNLQRQLNYDDVLAVSKKILINDLNEDTLYDEVDTVNRVQEEIMKLKLSVDQMWVQIFKESNFSELPKLVGKILSIPVSNAFVERVFSLMGNLWADEWAIAWTLQW